MGDGGDEEDDFVVIFVPLLCTGRFMCTLVSASESMTVYLIEDVSLVAKLAVITKFRRWEEIRRGKIWNSNRRVIAETVWIAVPMTIDRRDDRSDFAAGHRAFHRAGNCGETGEAIEM